MKATIDAMRQTLSFLRSGNFAYPRKIADDLREAIAREEAQPKSFAKLYADNAAGIEVERLAMTEEAQTVPQGEREALIARMQAHAELHETLDDPEQIQWAQDLRDTADMLAADAPMEWWAGSRKITIYPHGKVLLKTWGPNIDTEMETVPLQGAGAVLAAFEWLAADAQRNVTSMEDHVLRNAVIRAGTVVDKGRLAQQAAVPHGWDLAKKVYADLDRKSCPGVYLQIATESIVKHCATPQPPQAERVPLDDEHRKAIIESAINGNPGMSSAQYVGWIIDATERAHGIGVNP